MQFDESTRTIIGILVILALWYGSQRILKRRLSTPKKSEDKTDPLLVSDGTILGDLALYSTRDRSRRCEPDCAGYSPIHAERCACGKNE